MIQARAIVWVLLEQTKLRIVARSRCAVKNARDDVHESLCRRALAIPADECE